MKDGRFFKRRCFVIRSDDLLEFMKEQEDDNSLTLEMEKDTKEIYLYSHGYDIEFNEDDIIDRVSIALGIEFNNLFVDGDKYYSTIYFTERKLGN